MSKCISGQGEYSEQAPGDEEFVCGRCYVVDEEAMRAEIERLRADSPSVTDNARACHMTHPHTAHRWDVEDREPLRYECAGRAETTTAGDEVHPSGVSFRWEDDLAETTTATDEVHLTNPDDGASFCDQPATIITEAGDTRPVCQTCHRRAMKHAHARAETTRDDRDAAQVITDYLAAYTLPANYTYPDNPHETNGSVAKRCGPLIADELDRLGLLATARTRPTRYEVARAIRLSRTNGLCKPGVRCDLCDCTQEYEDDLALRDADAVLALLNEEADRG